MNGIDRSFIIPVLDYSPHSPYNINTLLEDLAEANGEVICIFNSEKVFEDLKKHPRIDKFCYNSSNAGVSRSWNMGINLAEGEVLYILNADLHIDLDSLGVLEDCLVANEDALIVGPEGSDLKYINQQLSVDSMYKKGAVGGIQKVDNVSGFCMALLRERFVSNGFSFDTRFSPCFMEEWDIGLQAQLGGMSCYVVSMSGYDHHWGISLDNGQSINYFGRDMSRSDILKKNSQLFADKWFPILDQYWHSKASVNQ